MRGGYEENHQKRVKLGTEIKMGFEAIIMV